MMLRYFSIENCTSIDKIEHFYSSLSLQWHLRSLDRDLRFQEGKLGGSGLGRNADVRAKRMPFRISMILSQSQLQTMVWGLNKIIHNGSHFALLTLLLTGHIDSDLKHVLYFGAIQFINHVLLSIWPHNRDSHKQWQWWQNSAWIAIPWLSVNGQHLF